MVDRLIGPTLGHRLLFVGLALASLYLRLLPGVRADDAWPGPDLLVCIVFCWTLRRPDYLPILLVAAVIFAEDLLLMRPPGLWTALVVLGAEFLRSRTDLARELNLGAEWLLVGLVLVAMLLASRVILGIAVLPQIPFDASIRQLFSTLLSYPIVVGISVLVFGLHKPATGELDAAGRRL